MTTPQPAARGSRRSKLWELEHKCHCPVIGVCFDLQRIRQLVGKVMQLTPTTSDFEIHFTAVRECTSRSRLSELLHKELERHHALSITRAKAAKNTEQLTRFWLDALAITDIAGPLWATLTHPHCTAELVQRIYGDIHMLQHQVGAGERTDQSTLRKLQQDNARLEQTASLLQDKLNDLRQHQAREIEHLKGELAQTRTELLGQEQATARSQGELIALREHLHHTDAPLALSRRAQQAEARCQTFGARVKELERLNQQLQQENAQLALEIARRPRPLPCPVETQPDNPEDTLAGRAVLCVGGRTGAAQHYRNLVEQLGGRFIHHDGGQEENLARLDGSIAAADAVICQAGCISHNAYWRVKAMCKRTGKPCLYLKTPSLSTFVRGLESLTQAPPPDSTPVTPA